MLTSPLHYNPKQTAKMRKHRQKKHRFSRTLTGFVLVEALVAVLVLIITTTFFARFGGNLVGAHAQSRHYYRATAAARSYLEMAVRLGVPGWYADGRHAVRLAAVEVAEPQVLQDGQPAYAALPRIRFAHAVASAPPGREYPPVVLLAAVPKHATVTL